jgi:hypothetical protein
MLTLIATLFGSGVRVDGCLALSLLAWSGEAVLAMACWRHWDLALSVIADRLSPAGNGW